MSLSQHLNALKAPEVQTLGALKSVPEECLFEVKTANDWINEAALIPDAKLLFDEFWREGELCVLFADSGNGKSLLAVQIADSITSGKPILGLKNEVQNEGVLLFDLELSPKQLEKRYKGPNNVHHEFSPLLYRAQFRPEAIEQNRLLIDIENAILLTGSKIVIIDNISYLGNELDKGKDALPLMKGFKDLKQRLNLSLLIIAHTPKRPLHLPINQNDLAGSKSIFNFIDSCFAIGKSAQGPSKRYIKQLKARDNVEVYHSENVIGCELKQNENFTKFEFLEFGYEKDHLQKVSSKEDLKGLAAELSNQGHNQRKIAEILKCSPGKVNGLLRRKKDE